MIHKNVKLVSIDAMNTIIKLRETVVYPKFAKNMRIDADPSTVLSNFKVAFREVENEMPCYAFNQGGPIVWWTEICDDRILLSELALKIYDYYSSINAWSLVDDKVVESIKTLKSRGYFISITSNFDSRLRKLLHEFELIPHVDFLALSGELAVAKPDPAIFEVLMRRFYLKDPGEILHIGDDYEKDYLAARDFGSQAYLIARNPLKFNIDSSHVVNAVNDLVG